MNNPLKGILVSLLGLVALLFVSSAQAHFPTLNCQHDTKDSAYLICTAGFSDASLAGVVELKVFSYDEELLFKVNTATDGSAKVKKPTGEYYILFDAGHESPAEFDYAELE